MTEFLNLDPVPKQDEATALPHVAVPAAAEAGPPEPRGSGSGPVPEQVREAARLAPDHWLSMIDPTWSGEGAPPQWAIVGRWRSGPDGEITEWQDNEEYEPSPKALGWPEPTDTVDAAVQLAATGYGPAEAVPRALASAEVAVFIAPDGAPLAAVAPDEETPVVPVFTSPGHLHTAGRLAFKQVRIPDLLDQLAAGHMIYLNPSGPVSMAVDTDDLRKAVKEAAQGENTRLADDRADVQDRP